MFKATVKEFIIRPHPYFFIIERLVNHGPALRRLDYRIDGKELVFGTAFDVSKNHVQISERKFHFLNPHLNAI